MLTEKSPTAFNFTGFIKGILTCPITEDDKWIYGGLKKRDQGWILHLSAIPGTIQDLYKLVFNAIKDFDIAFRVLKTDLSVYQLNMGEFGEHLIGKAITIYTQTDEDTKTIARLLLSLTGNFKAPRPITDIKLGPVLFARFGSYGTLQGEDPMGNICNLLINNQNQYVIDRYETPHYLPEWAANVFDIPEIPQPTYKPGAIIGPGHRILKVLKFDLRGNVYKGFYIKNLLRFGKCVLKGGTWCMFIDPAGRDMCDRIRWQYQLHLQLQKIIPLPGLIDAFSDYGDEYIAIKFIKGESLYDLIEKLTRNIYWLDIPAPIIKKLINYLIQILDITDKLHAEKIVFRDLSTNNFLVGKNDKLTIIDFELAYCTERQYPYPPFGKGTFWVEGREFIHPVPQDDIYSFGAMMLYILSGIHPDKLLKQDKRSLLAKIAWLTGNPTTAGVIYQCLEYDPENRPEISVIKNAITLLGTNPTINNQTAHQVNTYIPPLIQHGITGLNNFMGITDNYWISQIFTDAVHEFSPQSQRVKYEYINRGAAGTILFFALVDSFNYDKSIIQELLNNTITYLLKSYLPDNPNIFSSLHVGGAGIAVALSAAIRSGLITAAEETLPLITQCLSQDNNFLDIFYGIAGKGEALLLCEQHLDPAFLRQSVTNITDILIQCQEKDGSWIFPPVSANNEPAKITGFAHGAAGIINFLLDSYRRFKNPLTLAAAQKGLQWLMKTAIKEKDAWLWPISNKDKSIKKTWCQGSPGIALTFMRAYEITNTPSYKTIAEKAMRAHPPRVIMNNLGICHGISGLGEVYLEAYRIFRDQEWLDRATWIVEVLQNLKITGENENECYWLADNHMFPTADFMVGNTGILHFLIRYAHPDKLGFPLIPA
ncbi:protein kinase/lanthionine synthetase C family protein [Chitinophaga solisilvae]|uniref:protein kinase/lanthionine synthetase C family protein n=1 Tax=Chitinophaga solisilvae TaxID=1233460 RepID=UPI00136A37F7|nr:protein kinase/lanthionine synthetase C family protein [Chitinophaga solisilvae]